MIKAIKGNWIFLSFVKESAKLIVKCTIRTKNLDNAHDIRMIIFSVIPNISIYKEKGDHYYGHLFEQEEIINKKHILWVYQIHSRKEIKDLEEYLNSKGQRFLLLYDCLNMRDSFSIISSVFKSLNSAKKLKFLMPTFSISGYKSNLLAMKFHSENVILALPFMEMSIYYTFKKILN